MDSGELLWSTGVSHLCREKLKKSRDDAETNGYFGASVLLGDMVWPDNVEDDGQRDTAVGNWRHFPDARKAEKIE